MNKSLYTESASIRQENHKFFVQGALNTDTVVKLTKRGTQLITQLTTQTQDAKMHFDLKAVIIEDASAIAMLLSWIRAANKHRLAIEFSHLPEKLVAIAKLGGVDKIIQKEATHE